MLLLYQVNACGGRTALDPDIGTLDAAGETSTTVPPFGALPPSATPSNAQPFPTAPVQSSILPPVATPPAPPPPPGNNTPPIQEPPAMPEDDCPPLQPGTRTAFQLSIGPMPTPVSTAANIPSWACGDAALNANEECDDGNLLAGDGCSEVCETEPNYDCRPGKPCQYVSYCGDGIVMPPEQCDDSNLNAGDGCNDFCFVEAGYVCNVAGAACDANVACGNGVIERGEACDLGLLDPGSPSGCTIDCQVVPGWRCPAGIRCEPICGDGALSGNEQCDDGNTLPGDGCSERCQLAAGWTCLPGTACTPPICGNGVVEGGETCDVGGMDPAMNCDANCRLIPSCDADGACSSICGDALRASDGTEECDDGNSATGDGCYNCRVESGYECFGIVGPTAMTGSAPDEPAPDVQAQALELPLPDQGMPIGTSAPTMPPQATGTPAGTAPATAPPPADEDPLPECQSICGDGFQTAAEFCDDASFNGQGYDYCGATCSERPRCGDGVVSGPEQCDDGVNTSGYFTTEASCAPGCVLAPHCGDGVVDPAFDEQCDFGEQNDDNYGGCTLTCQVGPHCGDGIIDVCYEECDDGNRNNNDGCSLLCSYSPTIR